MSNSNYRKEQVVLLKRKEGNGINLDHFSPEQGENIFGNVGFQENEMLFQ